MVSFRSGKIITSHMLEINPDPPVFILVPLILLPNSLFDLIWIEPKAGKIDALVFAWCSFVKLTVEKSHSGFCVWVLLIVGKSVYYPDFPFGGKYMRLLRMREMISRGNVYLAIVPKRKYFGMLVEAGNTLGNRYKDKVNSRSMQS
jgi:hypothetical protein